MKKIFYFIILILLTFCINVDATEFNLELECPETAYEGDIVNCSIKSSIISGDLTGIMAKYNFENAEYISFDNNINWSIYANNLNGFVIGNVTNNISENENLGDITLKITGTVGNDSIISLKEINATDSEYNDLYTVNVSKNIKIIEKHADIEVASKTESVNNVIDNTSEINNTIEVSKEEESTVVFKEEFESKSILNDESIDDIKIDLNVFNKKNDITKLKESNITLFVKKIKNTIFNTITAIGKLF